MSVSERIRGKLAHSRTSALMGDERVNSGQNESSNMRVEEFHNI